jgi:hypothetical protein
MNPTAPSVVAAPVEGDLSGSGARAEQGGPAGGWTAWKVIEATPEAGHAGTMLVEVARARYL